MKNIKILNILLLVVSISLLLGCGGGGGSSSYIPINPDPDLPTDYQKAPAFNNKANEVYTCKSNTDNLAVDLPVGSTYLVSITNTSGNTQSISLVSSVTASIRVSMADEPQQSEVVNFADSFRYQEQAEAEMQFRMNFINKLKETNGKRVLHSARAGISGVDHSDEQVGGTYTIYTSNGSGSPVELNNVKLVAVTANAKFFVDQNSRMGYSPQVDLMERIVTEGDFALTKVFDSDTVNIYDFMETNFGKFHDVDNDGKVSVIITPYLSSMNSSYLGLFMNYCMLESFVDPRDQILIAPPLNNLRGENYFRSSAITNLCHEYQHLVNFSQRFYRNGNYSFNSDDSTKYMQELYFDEGCSVCSEALFRRARGKKGFSTLYDYKTNEYLSREYTGNDPRFNDCFSYSNKGNFSNVFPFYIASEDASRPYYKYGRNGLFMLYLHDRFPENFKKLIEQPFTGNGLKEVIPQTLGVPNLTLDDLQRDWHFALQHEYLKTELDKLGEELTTDPRFKYEDWLKLNSQNKTLENKSVSVSLSSGYTTLVKLKPEIATSPDNTSRFFIKSSGDSSNKYLEINIIKL